MTQLVLFWKLHLLHGIRGSAYSLTLHVRAVSARAWQLVLQMKSTLVYSASLMACFPLPAEQPGSLKGTCCLLILNLLQAYLGICLFLLLPSLAHLPVPSTCAAEKHCTSRKSGRDLHSVLKFSSTVSPCCALSFSISDLFSAERWGDFWWTGSGITWQAGRHACGKLQTQSSLFHWGAVLTRTLHYLWYTAWPYVTVWSACILQYCQRVYQLLM